MADVVRQCPTCASQVKVSEVAESFLCPSCKVRVPVVAVAAVAAEVKPRLRTLEPGAQAAGGQTAQGQGAPPGAAARASGPTPGAQRHAPAPAGAGRRLRLRDGSPGSPSTESPSASQESFALGSGIRPKLKAKPRGGAAVTTYHMVSWLVFLALGALMGWLRYGGGLPAAHMDTWREAAPYVVLFLHTVLVCFAFSDTVFAGILSFLLPPYVYYHLFAVSDQFYLRAVVAGLLVGVGQDGFGTVAEWVVGWAHSVDAFIRSGG